MGATAVESIKLPELLLDESLALELPSCSAETPKCAPDGESTSERAEENVTVVPPRSPEASVLLLYG